jgi:hypothetical protein
MESVMLFGRKAEKAAPPAPPPKTAEAKSPPEHRSIRQDRRYRAPSRRNVQALPSAISTGPIARKTFADSITGLFFDGQTLRIEFGVTRVDDAKPNVALTGRRYPGCRLVLSPAAAIDLVNKMQQIATALAPSPASPSRSRKRMPESSTDPDLGSDSGPERAI